LKEKFEKYKLARIANNDGFLKKQFLA
jgi:hypothetical protein